jgi:hypothetical protein
MSDAPDRHAAAAWCTELSRSAILRYQSAHIWETDLFTVEHDYRAVRTLERRSHGWRCMQR